jgi:uncharacterized protein YdcH (DUF465 family)
MFGRDDTSIRERLARENEEFRRMVLEHEELERQVRELERRVYLSAEEEGELKRIKKLKLAGKDRMEAMLAAYR